MKLYNTLSKSIEELKPLQDQQVGLYTCGPTVYDFAHIGNLRTYIFEDLLRRSLVYLGYTVNHAMNITDVGHLVGDGDEGEDKMDKGAMREGRHPLEIARQYEEQFFNDLEALKVLRPHTMLRATDAIPEQIEIIKVLEEKGYTYKDEFAVYFDTSRLADYGKLSGQKLEEKKVGARADVVVDIKKKNPQDFVLWFFTKGKYENHILRWQSPWGEGFPGWHIECSAISRKLLGQSFDIHAGGVDHIGTHHTNEIAQSEAAFGVPLANIWVHGEHLVINATRMGKSEGNAYTLQTVIDKGFSPMDYRYFCLQAHYRTQLNFTWEALAAASTGLARLHAAVAKLPAAATQLSPLAQEYTKNFTNAISNDLNIPIALALVFETIANDSLTPAEKRALITNFDTVLGLGLDSPPINVTLQVPENVQKLIYEREQARANKDFAKSDELRAQIEAAGFEVLDTADGQQVRKK